MTAEGDRIANRAHDALSQILSEVEKGSMVTRWVLVIESIDSTGIEGLWTLGSPGCKSWDTLGLLDYAKQVEIRHIMNRES